MVKVASLSTTGARTMASISNRWAQITTGSKSSRTNFNKCVILGLLYLLLECKLINSVSLDSLNNFFREVVLVGIVLFLRIKVTCK